MTSKGLTISNGGLVVKTGGLTVLNNGVYITTSGLSVISGGLFVTTSGLTVASGGLYVTGGFSVASSGAVISGGLTVGSSGMAISGGLTVLNSGILVSGGLSVKDTGMTILAGGLTVSSGGAVFGGGMSVSSGLYVTGGVSVVSGGLEVTGGLTVNGNFAAQNAPVIFSDRRLKTQLEPITDALAKVSRLRGVYFNWIQNEPSGLQLDDQRHVGLMAQEVLAVLPEAVGRSPLDDRYLGVDYTAIVPLLIESIHDLEDLVQQRENEDPSSSSSSSRKEDSNCDFSSVESELKAMRADLESIHLASDQMNDSIRKLRMETEEMLASASPSFSSSIPQLISRGKLSISRRLQSTLLRQRVAAT